MLGERIHSTNLLIVAEGTIKEGITGVRLIGFCPLPERLERETGVSVLSLRPVSGAPFKGDTTEAPIRNIMCPLLVIERPDCA